jgi:predicted transglutaminase-like cysteine proteinase
MPESARKLFFNHLCQTVLMLCSILPHTALAEQSSYLSQSMLIEVQNQYGEQSMGRLRSWQEMIVNSTSAADIEKLRLANEFINRNQLAPSQDYQDNSNYRATPLEFLILGSGDSEDFAIAKYITLREMGVEASKLRLTYSQSIEDDSYQMILAYYQSPDKEPLLLDNIENQIRPASANKDIRPLYSFRSKDILLIHSAIKMDLEMQSSPSKEVSRQWHKFVNKMQSVHY